MTLLLHKSPVCQPPSAYTSLLCECCSSQMHFPRMLQGPTPEDVIVASGATVIEETPSSGSAGRRLAAAASMAELPLRPNAESDVDSPTANAPREPVALAALVPPRRRTVLRPMRGATADQHVSVWLSLASLTRQSFGVVTIVQNCCCKLTVNLAVAMPAAGAHCCSLAPATKRPFTINLLSLQPVCTTQKLSCVCGVRTGMRRDPNALLESDVDSPQPSTPQQPWLRPLRSVQSPSPAAPSEASVQDAVRGTRSAPALQLPGMHAEACGGAAQQPALSAGANSAPAPRLMQHSEGQQAAEAAPAQPAAAARQSAAAIEGAPTRTGAMSAPVRRSQRDGVGQANAVSARAHSALAAGRATAAAGGPSLGAGAWLPATG